MVEKLPVTILIHTKNEEVNIPHSLDSVVGRFNQIFVVDAGSTDRTREVVEGYDGVTFVQIEGDRSTLVKQRNWALDTLPFENEWIYIHDADEQVSEALYDEIAALFAGGAQPPEDVDAYMLRYKEIILGRWVKRAGFYPNWGIRLIRNHIRWENRAVNSSLKAEPERTRQFQSHFIHDDKRGFVAYIRRLGSISVVEAKNIDEIYKDDPDRLQPKLFTRDPLRRRRALKKIFNRLPGRPLVAFCYLYFWRGGILEGWPGFYAAYLRMTHEVFIGAHKYDMNKTEKVYDGK